MEILPYKVRAGVHDEPARRNILPAFLKNGIAQKAMTG